MKKSLQSEIKSSFRGYFDELPGLYADNFENAQQQNARVYFLSHYHQDHIQGLHTRQLLNVLIKNDVNIYTTELTAAIINDDKKDERIMNHVIGLKMGSTQIILPGIPERNLPMLSIQVTLIPAGHCAGSTMFLFSTKTNNILYTGDFRINVNDLSKYKALHNKEGPIRLDALYIDTTFLDAKFKVFPKRSKSIKVAVEEIKKWLNMDKTNAVALHTSAKYGYEYVFNEIYEKLDTKVYVGPDRWTFYSLIPELVPGVTDQESRIHLCRNKYDTYTHDACTYNCYNKFLYVHLSCMKWENYREDLPSVSHVPDTRIDVCFATHCSEGEIYYFVNYFKPNKIIGFPYLYHTRKRKIVDNNNVKVKNVKKFDSDDLK